MTRRPANGAKITETNLAGRRTDLMLRRAALAVLLIACADTGDAAAPVARDPEAVRASAAPADPARDAARPGDAGDAPDAGDAIPTTPDAMKAWLLAGRYPTWAKEGAPHPSAGPHASSVLTYVNAELDTSLASNAPEHPAGAAAVKEFLGPAGVKGWAVAVKTQAASAGGEGWYWYETFSTAPAAHGIEGQGATICVSCHDSGRDFVLTPYPLR